MNCLHSWSRNVRCVEASFCLCACAFSCVLWGVREREREREREMKEEETLRDKEMGEDLEKAYC